MRNAFDRCVYGEIIINFIRVLYPIFATQKRAGGICVIMENETQVIFTYRIPIHTKNRTNTNSGYQFLTRERACDF